VGTKFRTELANTEKPDYVPVTSRVKGIEILFGLPNPGDPGRVVYVRPGTNPDACNWYGDTGDEWVILG